MYVEIMLNFINKEMCCLDTRFLYHFHKNVNIGWWKIYSQDITLTVLMAMEN